MKRKKYLIETGPGIGDVIQHLSMGRAIKEQEPNAQVDLLMKGSPRVYEINCELLKCQHYIDNLYWYSFKYPLQNLKLLIQLLKKRGYDFGFVSVESVTGYLSLWPYRIMRAVRCNKIIGTGYNGLDIVIKNPVPVHYLERNAQFLIAAGIKPRKDAVSIFIEDLDKKWISAISIPSVGVVIGLSVGTNPVKWIENGLTTTYDVKSWPYERWIELTRLLSQKGLGVVLIGGKKEMEEIRNQNISIPNNQNVINLIGKTTIAQSLSVINRCDIMVGSEGGMMHAASALGVKTLTIFGGTDSRIWNPGGSNSPKIESLCKYAPCYGTRRASICKEHKCLNNISVNMVEDKIYSLLEINMK